MAFLKNLNLQRLETTPVNGHKISILIRSLLIFLYACCLLLIGGFAFKRPVYNWDMLAYMALVLKMDHHDMNQIHKITYNTARENIPPVEYKYLIESPYRERMAASSVDFYAQLPFYAAKPLYIGMVYLFYKAGFSLPKSTVLPSILCYFLTGLLLFHWLRRYFNPFLTFVAGLLIMFSIYMVNIARISTPDSLSTFLLFAAFFLFLKSRP